MKAIIIYIVSVAVIYFGIFLISEQRAKKVMEVEWCYAEYEVDGTPNIDSKYVCENE